MTNEQLGTFQEFPEFIKRINAALNGLSPLESARILSSVHLEGTDQGSLEKATAQIEREARAIQKPKSGAGALLLGFGAIFLGMAVASAVGGKRRD